MFSDLNNKNSTSKIKRNLPIVGLVILTVSLLICFGIEQFDNSSKTNENDLLSDLYSNTLKPLFLEEKLTKEDVLNFALYNNLPVDKRENKILEVKNNSVGDEIIEIKKADIKKDTDNYSKFVNIMNLDKRQKNELDSLLEEFKKNITNTIFSDDEQTLAVDARIGLLHRVLRTEIFDFISRIKTKRSVEQLYAEGTLESFNEAIEKERNKSVRSYIFFTPDTVIQSEAEFVRGKTSQPVNKNEPSVFMPVLKVVSERDATKEEKEFISFFSKPIKIATYNIFREIYNKCFVVKILEL